MKQRLIFLLFYCFAFYFSFCQDTLGGANHCFVVNVGPSVPVDEFGQHEFGRSAGFATLGANLEVDYYIFPTRYFGFNACVGYATWGFNREAYRDAYYQVLGKNSGIRVDAGRYHSSRCMLGIALKSPVIRGFEILLSGQLGFARSTHPQISVDDAQYGSLNQVPSSSDVSFQASNGVMLSYYLDTRYAVHFAYRGNATDPGFIDPSSLTGYFDQPFYYRNFNLGLTIHL